MQISHAQLLGVVRKVNPLVGPSLLERALQLYDSPLLLTLDERDIDAAGQYRPSGHSVASGRQVLAEATAVLSGLQASGMLDRPSNGTLMVVYGTQQQMRYRILLAAAALGNVHALFLPLYHNLGAALRRLRLQWPAEQQPRVALFAPGLYAQQACDLGIAMAVATSGEAPSCSSQTGMGYEALLELSRARREAPWRVPTHGASSAFFAPRQDEYSQPAFVIIRWETILRFAANAVHVPWSVPSRAAAAAAAPAAPAAPAPAPAASAAGGVTRAAAFGFFPASSADTVGLFARAFAQLNNETAPIALLTLGLVRSAPFFAAFGPAAHGQSAVFAGR